MKPPVLMPLCGLVLVAALAPLIVFPMDVSAQEDEGESSGGSGWRPHGGSLFGGSRPPQQNTTGEDLMEGSAGEAAAEPSQDERVELLVFGLEYADNVSFRDTYLERFETTFREALEASPSFRALSDLERQRRMSQAAQMVVEPDEERVEQVAAAIGSPYYLLARVGVADARSYLISFAVGRTGEGEAGRQLFERTTNRSVDNVNNAIEDMASQALAVPVGE